MNLIGASTAGGEPLANPAEERFAAALVKHGNNATAAYLEAFPETTAARPTVWSMACRLRGRPDVALRYHQLRAAALQAIGIDLASLVQDTHDIATADPAELVRPVTGCCRHCHGHEFKYQWRDVDEYVAACDEVAADNERRREQSQTGRTVDKPLPTDDGGYGFNPHTPPNPACPQCMGCGTLHVIIADVTTVSPKAAKLYKGIKMTAGGPEVLMHDQQAARDMLHKMAGIYKDGAPLPGAPGDSSVPTDVAIEDAGEVYMQLVHGGAPA